MGKFASVVSVATLAATLTGETMCLPLPPFTETEICANDTVPGLTCTKQDYPFERILDVQAGYQWDDAGGYCGSWATQRAVLAKGAWISQQQVRDHTTPCGGHDSEILSCNIEEAYKNLKLLYEAFDYHTTPLPQQAEFFKWLKQQLVAGNAVAWMIMWSGQEYPIYNLKPPAGMYGHVEPVIGIQSNHPLNDTKVYDDDVVVHLTDGGTSAVHRVMTTLPCKWAGVGRKADCGLMYRYGIGPYGFGYAVHGFNGSEPAARPAFLHVEPFVREPDTRSGQSPIQLKGTLTISELEAHQEYDIYRWDSVEDAFTYSSQFVSTSFSQKAGATTFVYEDEKSFASNGTTYYSCVAKK